MLQDFRFALRTFRRRLDANALAVVMLALGLGACAVIFSLVEALLLRPLDFENPRQLVRLYSTQDRAGSDKLRVAEGPFFDWRRDSRTFSSLVAAQNTGLSVTDPGTALNPLMRRVSSGYFETFGVRPALGRTFRPEEYDGPARVVILDFGFWQSYFAGDPDVVGKTIELANASYEVVGVMPAAYAHPSFPARPVLWLPMAEAAESNRGRGTLLVFGRLAEGQSLRDAEAEMARLDAELAARHPATDAGRRTRLVRLHDSLNEDVRPALWALFGAVVFVLLMAWTNVSNLLLAQAVGRQQEISMRLALGAGRRHLLRQLLVECLVLAAVAAGLGLLIAFWTVGPLQSMAPSNTSVPLLDQVRIDLRVVLFTAALALSTGLLFGFLPMTHLLDGGRSTIRGHRTPGAGRRRLRSVLVIAEVALSLILLIGAGLMVRTFLSLQHLELGFEPENLLVLRTNARGPQFTDADAWRRFYDRALEDLAAVPGVEDAGACEILPMFSSFRPALPVRWLDGPAVEREAPAQAVPLRVSTGFFRVNGQPILRGRAFSDDDRADSEPVAVLSESLARRLWGSDEALGRQIVLGEETVTALRVVGVAADLRGLAQAPEPPPNLYLPYAQSPVQAMSLFLRSSVEPQAIFEAGERVIGEISREAPVFAQSTLEQIVRDIEWQPRFTMQLLLAFATLALLLALSGLFAVLSYEVMERRREISVRVAVGADRDAIVRLVLANAARLTAVGLVIGLAGALALSRFLESQLYGVEAVDPLTYGVLIAAMVACALLAAYLPARRATAVDPIEALRSE